MKIERVDDKTVKCFLTNEDLQEYNIDYKDFVMRSEKAKEVVQNIIEQAEEKVGYKPPEFALDLQIMMLPEQGMVLTFSEKSPEDLEGDEQFRQYIKEMQDVLLRMRNRASQLGSSGEANGSPSDAAQGTEKHSGKKQVIRPEHAIFGFENLRVVLAYASALPKNLRVGSALYKMDGSYYLHLQKGAASYERFGRTCVQAMEFGKIYSGQAEALAALAEHGSCLIQEKALKKLRLDEEKKNK